MEIDIEEKFLYTSMLLESMKKSLIKKENLVVTHMRIKEVFTEWGIK